MSGIASVGRIFYRCMVIAILAVYASNAVEARLPNTSFNALLMGVIIGILGAFLSEAHILGRYLK